MRDGRETFIWSAALFSRSLDIYLSTSAAVAVVAVVVVVVVVVIAVAVVVVVVVVGSAEASPNNGENDAKILFIRSLSLTFIGWDPFNQFCISSYK